MNILRIYPSSINSRSIAEAVGTLRDGGLVIYPTDGLYALGCDALNNRAIEKICRIKDIDPRRNSLSIVCADISQASEYARIDNRAFGIMKRVLPGPFTLLLPASTTLPKVFKGRKIVGVRVPDNPIPRALAEALGAADTVGIENRMNFSHDEKGTREMFATYKSSMNMRYQEYAEEAACPDASERRQMRLTRRNRFFGK